MKDIKPLDFRIEPKSALPVYEQIKQEIKLLIISGYLEEGDRMVPIRDLAAMLKVNSNTIVKVYYQLDIEGFLDSQPGSGYFVKFDSGNNREARQELFERITGEYISKALQLGFSLEKMAVEIKRRKKKSGPSKKGKEEKKTEGDLNKKKESGVYKK
ncbi:MAG: GntR family transcriptional regulator [Candidatus Aminicenantes bacterium]|nr:GntR family transcriptional regulator [Candidatus Aminicenantes bacterium]